MRTAPILAVVLLVACSHAQSASEVAPAPALVAQEPVSPPPPAQVSKPPTPPVQPADIAPASVYFDYDSAELLPPTREVLQAFFDQAQKRPDQSIRIEGNCDERGTREYNLALGQRRADAAKKYLTDLGLDESRITTVSYGKEHPRALGQDEAAWRENRRDDLSPASAQAPVSQASR